MYTYTSRKRTRFEYGSLDEWTSSHDGNEYGSLEKRVWFIRERQHIFDVTTGEYTLLL